MTCMYVYSKSLVYVNLQDITHSIHYNPKFNAITHSFNKFNSQTNNFPAPTAAKRNQKPTACNHKTGRTGCFNHSVRIFINSQISCDRYYCFGSPGHLCRSIFGSSQTFLFARLVPLKIGNSKLFD